MHVVNEVLGHALLVTGFVFVMMLVIEYLNVLTRGNWDRVIARWQSAQTALAALLGVSPGCLGAFAVSSLYMHRVLTFGSLLAAMIATVGDETFVMLALFPGRTLAIMGILLATGVSAGMLADVVLGKHRTARSAHLPDYAPTHAGHAECITFSPRLWVAQWRRCTPHRGWLVLLLLVFLAGVAGGVIGDHHHGFEAGAALPHTEEGGWDWVRITLLIVTLAGLLVAATVPDHFLDEHLWNHLVRVHAWRIFLWTAGALAVTQVVVLNVPIETAVGAHRLPLLLLACLVGLIPASGPHLVFVTLFAQGALPFSTLLANCIVQDGHGMIPLLSHSRRAVVAVKAVKVVIALAAGLILQALGW